MVTDVTDDFSRQLVRAAIVAGAARVYACAPHAVPWQLPGVIPMILDTSDDESLERLCGSTQDATVLITTDSSMSWPPVAVGALDVSALTDHFAVTVLGTARVVAAFAPVLAAKGGGVIACVESVQAWINLTGAYGVAQSALWSAVNSMRTELRESGVHVMAAVGGLIEAEQPSVEDAARLVLEGIRDRVSEMVLDEYTARVRSALSGPIEQLYPELEG